MRIPLCCLLHAGRLAPSAECVGYTSPFRYLAGQRYYPTTVEVLLSLAPLFCPLTSSNPNSLMTDVMCFQSKGRINALAAIPAESGKPAIVVVAADGGLSLLSLEHWNLARKEQRSGFLFL